MSQQSQTEKPGHRRALSAAALLCFSAAATVYVSANSLSTSQTNYSLEASTLSISDEILNTQQTTNSHRRSLSIPLPNGGCKVQYAHVANIDIPPTWQASFPGSGSRMTWSLVEALTGIRTTDDFDSHNRGFTRTVAVKTHYPIKDAKHAFKDLDPMFDRAMVILRNPINAIPSYFNLQYEHLNHLPNHSTRGPNKDWIEYRDNDGFGVLIQLQNYESFVEYWMERYPSRHQLLLASYEDLTDNILGPAVSTRIANFLGQSEGVNPIVERAIPCVWQTVVNYKNTPTIVKDFEWPEGLQNDSLKIKKGRRKLQKTFADPSSLRRGPKIRPYTEENLMMMFAMFQRLLEKYSHDEEFVRIMLSYIETVSNTEPSLE